MANAPQLMAAFKGVAPVGLAAPASVAEMYDTPVKKSVATALQTMDDTTASVLSAVNQGLDQLEFTNQLAELLKTHGLWH
jgi:hypothetical protein